MQTTTTVREELRATGDVDDGVTRAAVTLTLVNGVPTELKMSVFEREWMRIVVGRRQAQCFSPIKMLMSLRAAIDETLEALKERGLVSEE